MSENDLPKHEILKNWILENIRNGNFNSGSKLPSENELAAKFGYSRQTVRQAIGVLAARDILVRERGSGTFVNNFNQVSKKKTMRVGVITTYLDDYIFPGIIHGIEEVLTYNGYTLTLGITYNKPLNEEKNLKNMMESGVDGLIIEGTKSALPSVNEYLYKQMKEKSIPIVFINGYYSKYNESYVVMDDVKAGSVLTDLLIESGHTKIGGFFKSDDIQGVKRYEGVTRTLKKNNLTIEDNSIIWYTTEDFNNLFSGNSDKFIMERINGNTAMVCYNDQVAEGLIKLLKRNKVKVPEDISIVSFDNSFLAKEIAYNLTSIIYPTKKIGNKSAEIIINRINNYKYNEKVKVQPEIKIRESIRKLNK
jgi:GntR family transcriptional regulator, arabinose operon transcriptional repressor